MDIASNNESEQSFKQAIAAFTSALEQLQRGEHAIARDHFKQVVADNPNETVLMDRCHTYITVCDRRLTPAPEAPTRPGDLYNTAVIQMNDGDTESAIRLLDHALQMEPGSARLLYARASARAIQAQADAAISDLRQAIAIDPTIRFQATNDPDFERIREEPSFIDIIEPTPTGV